MRGLRVVLTVALSATVTLAAGCGASSASPSAQPSNGVETLTASQILARSRAAAEKATSVHVVGTVTQGTQSEQLDLHLSKSGVAEGTISASGATVTLRLVQGSLYLKGDQAFWAQAAGDPATVARLVDHWVKSPASTSGLSGFASLTDMGQLFGRLLDPTGTLTKGGTTTVDGTPAVTLTDKDGVLAVALVGPPYPLRLSGASSGSGSLAFREWNAPVDVSAPPADQVLDLSSLVR